MGCHIQNHPEVFSWVSVEILKTHNICFISCVYHFDLNLTNWQTSTKHGGGTLTLTLPQVKSSLCTDLYLIIRLTRGSVCSHAFISFYISDLDVAKIIPKLNLQCSEHLSTTDFIIVTGTALLHVCVFKSCSCIKTLPEWTQLRCWFPDSSRHKVMRKYLNLIFASSKFSDTK